MASKRTLSVVLVAALFLGFFGIHELFASLASGAVGAGAMAGAALGLCGVLLDYRRFKSFGVALPVETWIAWGLLLAAITSATMAIIAAQENADLYFILIFSGAFALFGTVFRLIAGPKLPKSQKEKDREWNRALTGDLDWKGGEILEEAVRSAGSPWPGRMLVIVGGVLMAAGAMGSFIVGFAGLALMIGGVWLLRLRGTLTRHGAAWISAAALPFDLDNGIVGQINLSRPPEGPATATLSCIERRYEKASGDAKGRVEMETHYEESAPLTDGSFAFHPRKNLPRSRSPKSLKEKEVIWSLTATAPGWRAVFILPVQR